MSSTGDLYCYRIDCSSLSADEYENLEKRIDNVAFLGLRYNPHSKIGEFFLSAGQSEDYLEYIKIPDSCKWSRVR